MGADFPDKAKKAFEKTWDDGLRRLNTSTLFDQKIESRRRSITATLSPGLTCELGAKLVVEKGSNGNLLITRNLEVIAAAEITSDEVASAIEQNAGCVTGTLEQVNPISGTVEISLANE